MTVYANFYFLYKYSMTLYITDTQTTLRDILIQCICQLEHNELNDLKQVTSIENLIKSLKISEKVKLRDWTYEMIYRMDFLCFSRSTKWLARYLELLDTLELVLDNELRDRQEQLTTRSRSHLKSWNLLYHLFQDLWMQHLRYGVSSPKRNYLQNVLSQLWVKKEKKSSKKSRLKTWRTISQSDIVIRR